MAEKIKTSSHVKHVPKDAQVIMSIIKDMGIEQYEPKVINQLLEFTYRYITCTLDDSRIYASHAKKKFIDLDDVRLAVKMQLEKTFTNPPPRDVLLEVARAKNNIALPFVKPNNGLRLPPDRYCLIAANYKLKPVIKKPIGKPIHTIVGNNLLSGQSRVRVDANKSGLSVVKRPGTLSTISRTQTISVPKPVFKFSTHFPTTPKITIVPHSYTPIIRISGTSLPSGQSSTVKPKIQNATSQPLSSSSMDIDESLKRKREDDEHEIQ